MLNAAAQSCLVTWTMTPPHDGSCLLQILALVAMEKPISMSADDIRDEKVKVLRALREIKLDEVVIGQHSRGNGIEGYLEDEGVPSDSKTPTFAAMILHIDNDRSRRILSFFYWLKYCDSSSHA